MIRSNEKLSRFFLAADRAFCVICCALLVLIGGATCLQVFCRHVLQAPLTWTEEFSRLCFIWLNCFGCAMVIRRKQEIKFAILADKILSEKGQKVLRIAIDGVLILFFIWAFGPALTLVEKMNKSLSAALQWPAGVFHLGFAVGSLAIVIAYAGDILEALGVIRGEEEEHVD